MVSEKQEQMKPQISRKEIIKIGTEINEIESKAKYKGSIKQRVGPLAGLTEKERRPNKYN
jgi:hypothetical protein